MSAAPLLVKAATEGRTISHVTPESAGWRFVGFEALRLAPGESHADQTGGRELCIVIVSGRVSVRSGELAWEDIGGRANPFEDVAPFAIYLPPGRDVGITAVTAAEVALCWAPAAKGEAPRLIEPSSMRRTVRGSGSNTRFVRDILPETAAAEALLVVEVITPPGNSSSYPPHKHDTDALPVESSLEETYYHRLNPPQGFAFQRVYTDDRTLDETMTVEDRDVVMVPRGYHPVVVPHGYTSYYLNVMAGPRRAWHFHNDPAHEWMLAPK
ncbi:MAG: 5-deoxy-glucuronate isomerase [Betaproteobacteria bacterium]